MINPLNINYNVTRQALGIQELIDGHYIDDTASLSNAIADINIKYDVCMHVFDHNGKEIITRPLVRHCYIHTASPDKIDEIINDARQSDALTSYIYTPSENTVQTGSFESGYTKITPLEFFKLRDNSNDQKSFMVSSQSFFDSNGHEVTVTCCTVLQRLILARYLMSMQFYYAIALFILIIILMAFVLSMQIARPIIEINSCANQLANGNYNVSFGHDGYREIAELKDTLNNFAKELYKSEKFQRELIANVSHDLRTPLTMIIGYSEIIRDIPSENTPENLQIIIDEATRLNRLVTDLLDLSKIQAGAGMDDLKYERFSLTNLVYKIIDRCRHIKEVEGYSIDFIYDKDVSIIADELRISQVIYNFLSNAITHTGDSKKIIVKQQVFKSYVRISCTDFGDGIQQDKLSDIWERYYKVDTNHKRATVGNGLGLSIVKNIVEMHNGRYGVTSEVGNGSTFWFELNLESDQS